MTNQQILDNAPEGATHWDGDTNHYLQGWFGYFRSYHLDRKYWHNTNDIDYPFVQSLADIRRIVELENALRKMIETTKNLIEAYDEQEQAVNS